jgi:hypothetical protein
MAYGLEVWINVNSVSLVVLDKEEEEEEVR